MLSTIDLIIVVAYALVLFGLAQWVSQEREGHDKNASDYFLAGKSLPWWAIGASLIAANISAEQIIGMSGSGYAIGLAIACYEWMAALTLVLVGKYLLPVFLKSGVYTMPQFLEQRYDHRVRMVMATFWLGVYVLVNLTSVLWLGSLALNTVAGIDQNLGLVLLGVFAASYSLYGGLKAVALTDILQVILLVAGGLIIVWILLDKIAPGEGPLMGFFALLERVPEKFDLIIDKSNPHYASLPGISVLVGGLWVMNVSYWGFNQYIIQRALGAKSLDEAQRGIVFAAFLKLMMPMIVVLPGIAMVALNTNLDTPDQAYPAAMTLLPSGVKGLVFAALLAAIVSSLASMCNSISTIFTMDVFPFLGNRELSDVKRVSVGRITAVIAMSIAMLAARPLLGKFDQAFQYIQEFTGFFTPGIVVIFLLGMFWRRTTPTAALLAAVGSAVLSVAFKVFWPELPFIDRVGLIFLLCVLLAVAWSQMFPKDQPGFLELDDIQFGTSTGFNIGAVVVVVCLIALYGTWW